MKVFLYYVWLYLVQFPLINTVTIVTILSTLVFLRAFMFSDDEEETKRVVRSQKDKRYVV